MPTNNAGANRPTPAERAEAIDRFLPYDAWVDLNDIRAKSREALADRYPHGHSYLDAIRRSQQTNWDCDVADYLIDRKKRGTAVNHDWEGESAFTVTAKWRATRPAPAKDGGTGVDSEGADNSKPLAMRLDALGEKLFLRRTDFLSKTVWPLLKDKKQIIFQGPPGTGKTFVARELAKFLAGSEDRVRVVQFHPSYAYEDFVQGFRPTLRDGQAGFDLRDGPLLQMADQAWYGDSDERHFLVIDEINRGNLSKILGELYYLLEYRPKDDNAEDDDAEDDEIEMRLQYSDEPFAMPPNLYIIGTMNTADRSIALVDLALRRRFHFVTFHPDEDPIKGLLGRWLDKYASDMKRVDDRVRRANEKLGNKEAAIGPSYFMKPNLNQEMADRIWKYNVLPYVEEQLYGDPGTLKEIKDLWPKPAGESEPQDGGTDAGEQGDVGETTPGGGDA